MNFGVIKKYQNNKNQYDIDTDSFIIHIKTEGVYKNIADDVEKRYDTSAYKADRSLPKEMNKKSQA